MAVFRTLGTSDIRVSTVAMGCWPISGMTSLNVTRDLSLATLAASRESGVNFFDTARTYGSYPHLREALDDWDSEVVIATKSKAATYDEMEQDIRAALEEMNIENIAIFHMHQVSSDEDFAARQGALECLLDYKKRGIVQSIGISAHSTKGIKAIMDCDDMDFMAQAINMCLKKHVIY